MTLATQAQPFSAVPGPRGLPLFGSVLDVWRDPLGLLCRTVRDHGDVARLKFGPYQYLLVNDADALQHVLQRSSTGYVKSRNYHGIKLVLGQGLLTSEGEHWRHQRKLVQPAFHHQRLRGFAATMAGATQDMVGRWDRFADDGRIVDVTAEMMRLTFRTVGLTLFSSDVQEEAQEIAEALDVAIRFANDYVEQVVRLPTWLPSPRNVRFRRALKRLDALVFRLIEEHRSGPDRGDLLGMLMNATDESGSGRMNDRQLRDEVMTLVLAGHETTAHALSWTWSLLAQHPDVAKRLRDEAATVLGDRRPTVEDLPRLEYTERVLSEAMRLYPPAWAFEREATEPDVVGGYQVGPGIVIVACTYALHRNPRYWDEPDRFDPDRFLPERSSGRPRYAYLPFGDGPRVCIGKGFAMMEAKIALAMTARRFELELDAGHPLELEPGITLRPRHGVVGRLRRVDAGSSAARIGERHAATAAQAP